MSEEGKNDLSLAVANDVATAEANAAALQQHLKIKQQQYEAEKAKLDKFWSDTYDSICRIDPQRIDFKNHELPLARIKKIMRLEDDLRDEGIGRFMISGDAPVILSKAAELFISELTVRAGGHTEENKRRTLQRHDICTAVAKVDTYDFLIDIVPREEVRPEKDREVKSENLQTQQYMLMQQQIANMGGTPLLPGVAQGLIERGALPLSPGINTSEPLPMQIMTAMNGQNQMPPIHAWQFPTMTQPQQQLQQKVHKKPSDSSKDNLGVLIASNQIQHTSNISVEGQSSQHQRSQQNMYIPLMAPNSTSGVQSQIAVPAYSSTSYNMHNGTHMKVPKEES